MRNRELVALEKKAGIYLPGVTDFIADDVSHDITVAMDAQPALVTVGSSGIPNYLTNYIDPKFIEVLITPMKAALIVGEEKKGDWTTETAIFPVIESTGEVSSYGDYNENGSTGANINFPQRQSYHYQTVTQWGERQLERAGLAKIDYANQLNIASAKVLNKFQNKSYFFGIAGLQNYGLLNDPRLYASLSPTSAWATSTADVIYEDLRRIFVQLQVQSGGLIEATDKFVLAMSPTLAPVLNKTNQYNVNVYDNLKKNFPNLRIETAVEYANPLTTGQFVQWIAEEVEGQKVATTAFTEKMRAHKIVVGMSEYRQKKSQGTWGTIIFLPYAIASMVGM